MYTLPVPPSTLVSLSCLQAFWLTLLTAFSMFGTILFGSDVSAFRVCDIPPWRPPKRI